MENWKTDLKEHFMEQKATKKEIEEKKKLKEKAGKRFIKKEVLPAFEEIEKELKKYRREAQVDSKKDWAALAVKKGKKKEFVYEINVSEEGDKVLASKSVYTPNKKGKLKLGVEGKISNPENSLALTNINKENIIDDFLAEYMEATRIKFTAAAG